MPDVHLFIDTNAFLTFYAFSNDDFEQLKKVKALIEAGDLALYLPDQVIVEFNRNRETKLEETLRTFNSHSEKSIPRIMEHYPEYAQYREKVKEVAKLKDALSVQVREDAQAKALQADKLFSEIAAVATILACDDDTADRANVRRLCGNPPGKKDSLGDQIIWECLLSHVPEGVEFNIVTLDGDYYSPLAKDRICDFLRDEWKTAKAAEIFAHKELRSLLNSKFPAIKFAVDVLKRKAIDKLVYSSSFHETHQSVAALTPFAETIILEEAKEIFDAGIKNSQIGWIGTDSDVNVFYRGLMETHGGKLDAEILQSLEALFPAKSDEPPDFPPFEDDDEPPF
ncbi:MAG TPA: PIN domain-containing protein [Burkholderiales bacterium]|jgi:hypothetical protein|nr:PIN domain-containing protein [Burkholderiales bacterium]